MNKEDEKIGSIGKEWDRLGAMDPFWSALTTPGKENSWDEQDFIKSGELEIFEVMSSMQNLDATLSFSKALDFGCGPGRLSIGLSNFFKIVVGVDIAESMIEVANGLRKKAKNDVSFILNNKKLLSIFPDKEFSFIYSNHVLQHMPKENSLKYIEEFYRVLSSGGVCAFFLPTERSSTFRNRVRKLVPSFLEPAIYRLRFGSFPVMEMHGVKTDVLCDIAKGLGFEILCVRESNDSSERWKNCFYVFKKPK